MALKRDNLDKLFSQYIRARAGWKCERCGKTRDQGQLDCAHVLGRRYISIRWNRMNAFCLCRTCHQYMTDNPPDWTDWVRARIGDDAVRGLREIVNSGIKLNAVHKEGIGKGLIEDLKKIGEKPVCGLGKLGKKKPKKKSKYKRKVNGKVVLRGEE